MSFYPKILKWQKVSHHDKKIENSANLSKCTEALKHISVSQSADCIIPASFKNIWIGLLDRIWNEDPYDE
jgi:hypothetical protein